MTLTFALSDWIQIAALVGAASVAYWRLDELSKLFASFKEDYVTKEVHALQIELLQLKIDTIKQQENN